MVQKWAICTTVSPSSFLWPLLVLLGWDFFIFVPPLVRCFAFGLFLKRRLCYLTLAFSWPMTYSLAIIPRHSSVNLCVPTCKLSWNLNSATLASSPSPSSCSCSFLLWSQVCNRTGGGQDYAINTISSPFRFWLSVVLLFFCFPLLVIMAHSMELSWPSFIVLFCLVICIIS